MPGYAILGEGEVTKQYAIDTLTAFRDKTTAKGATDTEFFMILPYVLQSDGKDEFLSNAMADILEWVEDEKVWARVFAAKSEDEDEQPTVEEFKVLPKRGGGTVYQAVVKDVIAEGGELLVIPHTMDWDEIDPRDEELVQAITAANQNGVVVRQLNNGLLELDLTDTEKEPAADDSPSEQDVRDMGESADKGDEDAATALGDLGKEYGFDIDAKPYDKMSWTEFAEAVLAKFAEDQNEDVDISSVPEGSQPQKFDLAELEARPIRSLRSQAIAEGWGKSGQNFPHWFLVKHIYEGTVPTKAQLDGKEKVPDEDPGEGAAEAAEKPSRGRGGAKGANTAQTPNDFLLGAAAALEGAGQALRAYVSTQ